MIKFNNPVKVEWNYIVDIFEHGKVLSGDGKYTKLCGEIMRNKFHIKNILLMTSGTAALELAAILLDIQCGDEVIMPSFTFCSTANAFVLRGARIKFIDIDPQTMNMDPNLIEAAITNRTKVIVPVHYGGVPCDMDSINAIAENRNLKVVEDAAQAVNCFYKGRACGSLSDYGCYSFHETKNYTMGEGGALCINNDEAFERAEIYREKGTDRSKFFRGEIDKYSWVEVGSSYLPSDINAAYLYPQLINADELKQDRLRTWNYYLEELEDLRTKGRIELPVIPRYADHNGHIFWIKTKDLNERTDLITFLKRREIYALFHYVPLHSSKAGRKYGDFIGRDNYTTSESERLLRLPIYYHMADEDRIRVVEAIYDFYKDK